MKNVLPFILCSVLLFSGCAKTEQTQPHDSSPSDVIADVSPEIIEENDDNICYITLSDSKISVDGKDISNAPGSGVYAANDIVFYLEGQSFTYGEGTKADEHSQEEADKHTVIHINEPGTYSLSGKLSAGQIAVDLGEDAEEDPEAVVTLILDGLDISCTVAPGVIFYNVYECGDKDNPTKDVDTSTAGANVMIADGSINNVNGSYVARIYKSYELSEDGTEVIDSKKLHKYDAAFYSKMTMNVDGDDGILNISAENEGLDSEMHLTVNGGVINIVSGNDGINTNEDGISVTTINGGTLRIRCDGSTGEGDGIDSNGWLVINGGTVIAEACSVSGDSGIDSDMGIHINGGTVIASGNMLDRIEGSSQTHAVFTFASQQDGGSYILKNADSEDVITASPENAFSILLVSSPELQPGTYSFWNGSIKLAANSGQNAGGMFGGFGGQRPDNMDIPERAEMPGDMLIPEGTERPEDIAPPEGMEMPEGMQGSMPSEPFGGEQRPEVPEGGEMPQMPETPDGMESIAPPDWMDGNQRPDRTFENGQMGEKSAEFIIAEGANYFNSVEAAQ